MEVIRLAAVTDNHHRKRHKLRRRFPLRKSGDRHQDFQFGQKLAQAGNQDFPDQDDASRKNRVMRQLSVIRQKQDDGSNEYLIRNRIKKPAERGNDFHPARKISVEKIRYSCSNEQPSCDPSFPVALCRHQKKNDRDNEHP